MIVALIFIGLSLPVIIKAWNKARGPEDELVDLADPDSLEDFPILKSFRLAISRSVSRLLTRKKSNNSTNLTKANIIKIDPAIGNPVVVVSNPLSSSRNLTCTAPTTTDIPTATDIPSSTNPPSHSQVSNHIKDQLVARKREILLAIAKSKAKTRAEELKSNNHTATNANANDLTLRTIIPDALVTSPRTLDNDRIVAKDASVTDPTVNSRIKSVSKSVVKTGIITSVKTAITTAVNTTTVNTTVVNMTTSKVLVDKSNVIDMKNTKDLIHKVDKDHLKNVNVIIAKESDLVEEKIRLEYTSNKLDKKDVYDDINLHRASAATSVVIDEVIDMLNEYESSTKFEKKDMYGRLLLHRACMTTSVDIDEVLHLLNVYPQGVQEKDLDGRLCLHLACLNECPEKTALVKLLLDQYSDGARVVDNDGRLPLHLHLSSMNSNEKLSVVKLLLEKHPEGAKTMDANGSLPLHLACENKADADVLEYLLLQYEEGVKVRDKNGRVPLHLSHMSSSIVSSYKIRNKWRNATEVKDIFGKVPSDYDQSSGAALWQQLLVLSARLKGRGHNICDSYLLKAGQFGRICKFILICDDSNSMNKRVCPGPGAPPVDPLSPDPPTRWTELRSTCEVVVELACAVSDGGIDVHFLNHIGALKGIHSTDQFIAGFPSKPHGSAPLARAIRDVIAANKKLPKGKMLVILFATDGETDGGEQEIKEVKEALASKPAWCKVQVLKITDNDAETSYLDEFDRAYEGVDVTDDYFSVLANVHKYRGKDTPFSFGDYLVKCLIGPLDREIDEIDEPERISELSLM